MSRIPHHALVSAVQKVRAMGLTQKAQLADELYRAQPHVLASFLVQNKLGVRLDKMEFLLELVLVCFEAMRESGLTWPLITEEEQDRQMTRLTASLRFGEDLPADQRGRASQQYIEAHPEKELLAFVQVETSNWLQRVAPEESDKYIVLAALNLVNCIAFVPMPTQTTRPRAAK